MTPPAPPALPPPDPAEQRQQTLDELRGTPDRQVGQASENVSGLSPEEEKGRRRLHRVDEDKAWADMRVVCIRWLGRVLIVGGIIATLGIMIAAGFWLYNQIIDPAKLDELIGKVVVAVLAFIGSKVLGQSKSKEE